MSLFHNSNQTLEPDMSVSISNFKPDGKTCAFECTDAEGKPKNPCEDGLLNDLVGPPDQKIAVVKYEMGDGKVFTRCYDEEALRKSAQVTRTDKEGKPIPETEFMIPNGSGVKLPRPKEWLNKRPHSQVQAGSAEELVMSWFSGDSDIPSWDSRWRGNEAGGM